MYEVGKREPDFESEEKIADFFNTDLNTLRGRDVETNSNKISDPDIRRIEVLSPIRYISFKRNEVKSKMMKILEASFDDYFGDDFIDEDND